MGSDPGSNGGHPLAFLAEQGGQVSGTTRTGTSGKRAWPPLSLTGDRPSPSPQLTLLEVIDALRAKAVSFTLEPERSGAESLTFNPALTTEAAELIEPWRVWLWHVADGRRTGHAPAVCDVCGEVSFLSVVTSSGTSRWAPSVGWPRCVSTARCTGHRMIREVDRFGVARVKYPQGRRTRGQRP